MSYLNSRGYIIPKNTLEEKELNAIKDQLTVTPKENHAVKTVFTPEKKVIVYRENENKLYIPRFYGIEKHGEPSKYEIPSGDNIQVPFQNELRDYQKEIVNVYLNHVKSGHGGGILEVPCGRGKCLGIDTPILMYDGTIKKVQDIMVGDILMGDDSMPRNVLSLARGHENMYRVYGKKGDGYIANESHILSLKYSINMNKNVRKGDVLDISIKDYLRLPKYFHGRAGPLVGYRVPIDFPEIEDVPIDPYLLGYWLGDGHSYSTNISTQESHVLFHLQHIFNTKHPKLYLQYTGQQYDYRINSINKIKSGSNEFRSFLFENQLIQNKHIPHMYKCNSRNIRLHLLAGFIDADGHYKDNCYDIIQKNETLLDDIVYLARSLGFCAFKKKCTKTCTNGKNGRVEGVYYRTNIYGSHLDEIPIKCNRKKAHPRKLTRNPLHYKIHLEYIGEDEYYGFEIDGNRRFVLGDFTVTHNTIMALNILSQLQKKTLIIVHKEFLLNQWVERMRDFLPTARVGKIQGKVFDIENKDVVIGMIQTMYDRPYPSNTFQSFGLTIIDEVHRVGSEEFSKTLLKVVTPYMLGISATVDRKDGLTELLYMFIGPKIYSEIRSDEDGVQVRCIQYEHSHEEYITEEFDMRGNIKYSTMINVISDFMPRKQFILKILQDLIEEDSEKQIMILSHKRDLLTYIETEINLKTFASCGQYVGGMKQAKLEESEGKQIVLATYAMAAEALDIKTLNTLVMVSPKTDIVQSVGRILRTRGNGKIIVDIVDQHDVFQNQWKKRRAYYKKSNYSIKMIKNEKYANMMNLSEWKTVYEKNDNANTKSEKRVCELLL
uniref:Helicase ATP-binding domain-containing protein n=1 Tax=viral metagenome TaxID=1070528 RepID=A0A6C0CLX5_9ZZZZ